MPSHNPPLIIKDGQVAENHWTVLAADATDVGTGQVIAPLSLWQQQPRNDVGVWLANDIDLTEVDPAIIQTPVIAIQFPGFMDGRGFSLARLLRERYGYNGEIRAIGYVIRDQLCYLQRCGFTAFELDPTTNLEAAVASLQDFSESYQAATDQPQPLFRRRAL